MNIKEENGVSIGKRLKNNLEKNKPYYEALHQKHIKNLVNFHLNSREKEYQEDQKVLEELFQRGRMQRNK